MTNKKKIVIGSLIAAIIIGLGAVYAFYSKYLSGAGPALLRPSQDITEVIPPTQLNSAPQPSVNTTGMPLLLPDGFSISVYAKDLGAPRELEFDPAGRLVASIPSQGKLVAFDSNNGVAGSPIPIIANLNKPHGFVFHCEGNNCKIYIAEVNSVKAYDYNTTTAKATNPKQILELPSGGNHVSRTLHLISTNDGPRLLVATGSSCNVCYEEDERRAAIWSAKLDGSDFKAYATGLRNSVFMATRPGTSEVWATDMGRDLLGDNTPPDEVNILEGPSSASGGSGQNSVPNFGWPICYSKNIHDTDFDKNKYIQDPCNDKIIPHIELQAHSAPLGLAFIPSNDGHYNTPWPEEYRGDLLVAFHGSWNRTTPTGYKIVRYDVDATGSVKGVSDFLTGFLPANSKTALGRPVDILVQPGGSMFVSDDKAGVIYKINFKF